MESDCCRRLQHGRSKHLFPGSDMSKGRRESPGRQGGRGEGAAGDAGEGCVTLCTWQRAPGAADGVRGGLRGLGSSERRGLAGEQHLGAGGGAREGAQPAGNAVGRPRGLHHLGARECSPAGAHRLRLPAGDLPAHRLVGQLAHAVELLLHRGPAAALARELGKDAARRRLHGSRAEPPGQRRRHCGASGSLWPERGSLRRAPPPTPPPAAAPAAASSSRAPPCLHPSAPGGLERRPGPPGCPPPAPIPRGDPGVSAG